MNFYNFNFAEQGKINFFERWGRDEETKKLIELTYLTSPHPGLTEVINKLKTILSKWIFTNGGDSCGATLSMIMEICNNAFEHSIIKDADDISTFGTCYILAQVYNNYPYKEVAISIGDLGIGIRRSLENKYNWVYPSDLRMISKVLNGLSGRIISDSGGTGIPFVMNTALNSFDGEFCIRTGKALVICNTKNQFIWKEYINEFPGTQCSIKLRCK